MQLDHGEISIDSDVEDASTGTPWSFHTDQHPIGLAGESDHQIHSTSYSNGDAHSGVDHVVMSQNHGDPICKPSFGIVAHLVSAPWCVFSSGLR